MGFAGSAVRIASVNCFVDGRSSSWLNKRLFALATGGVDCRLELEMSLDRSGFLNKETRSYQSRIAKVFGPAKFPHIGGTGI